MHDRGGATINTALIQAALIDAVIGLRWSRLARAGTGAALALLAACSDGASSRSMTPAYALSGDSSLPSGSGGTSMAPNGSPSNESGTMPAGSIPASNEGTPSVGELQNPAPGGGMPAAMAQSTPGLKFVGRVEVAGADDVSFAWSG